MAMKFRPLASGKSLLPLRTSDSSGLVVLLVRVPPRNSMREPPGLVSRTMKAVPPTAKPRLPSDESATSQSESRSPLSVVITELVCVSMTATSPPSPPLLVT